MRPDLPLKATENLCPAKAREGTACWDNKIRSPYLQLTAIQRTGPTPKPRKHHTGRIWAGGRASRGPSPPELGGRFAQGNSDFTKKPFLEWGSVGELKSKAHFIAPSQTPCIVRALAPLKPW